MPIYGPELNEPVSLLDFFAAGLESEPDSPALVSADKSYTWRELEEASGRLADNYLALGLKPGDRVASLMPNTTEILVHYAACLKAGLVITPLNYRYTAKEIDHALEVSDASILIAHAERGRDISESKMAPRLPLGLVRCHAKDSETPTLENLIESGKYTAHVHPHDPEDPAIIFFTSGSTGKPKGVTHTYNTLGWMIASNSAGYDINKGDVVLPGSSLSHVGGMLFGLTGLSVGARVVVARTFDAEEILHLLHNHRPTFLNMLPAALFALVREHGAKRDDFRSLKHCRSAGDKISSVLEDDFTELTGFPICEAWGMSEVGTATNNPTSSPHLGSVGLLNPSYKASIRNEKGEEVSPGEEGALWIKSPTMTVGYWANREATKKTIREGWLDTGDVMYADDNGYLWFRGRKKQIIVHDSSNISPQEVEESLLAHDAVENAGVVGIHDLVHGENVRAYVTLIAGAQRPTSQELIRLSRKSVGYKAPEEIVFLKEMPFTATGKVDRTTLKRMAEEQHENHLDHIT